MSAFDLHYCNELSSDGLTPTWVLPAVDRACCRVTMEMPSGEQGAQRHSATEGRRLVDYTAERLAALCSSAGFSSEREKLLGTYRSLLKPWGDMPLGKRSEWVSEISDDNTPVEFSVAIEGRRAEVRVLFEPHADTPTLHAFRDAGLNLHERLEREYQADLTRFRLLEDLFLPETMTGSFAVWSSAVFARGAAPMFKTYFNPQALGIRQAPALLEEAFRRLGMQQAVPYLRETVLRRGPYKDELKYFALDLTSTRQARVKVYARHHDSTPKELEFACSAARCYVPGEALEFARKMSNGERMQARAPFTCSAFTGESDDPRPAATTLYVPVCAYARDDAAVRRRVREYMLEKDIDPGVYESIIDGFANRPLDTGVGMQSWFAIRRYHGTTRFTVYLATEANRVHAPNTVPAPSHPPHAI